ncbi:MAG TPA: CBS domain-containing protein, partial [Planctomycetota bacterium]|nr:CBS domain-containing protein [Planctomycetota bacterium]
AWGILQILFVPRAMLGGLWLVFIGWFLLTAARRSRIELDLRRQLARLRVADAMRQDCVQVPPEEAVDRLVEDRVLKPGPRCFIVTREGAMEGLLTLDEIRRTPRDRWAVSTARDIMVPAQSVRSVPPDATLLEALDRMQAANVNQLPVVEDGRLRGLLTREDLLRALSLHLELSPTSQAEPRADLP